MEYVKLDASNLRVSRICLGCVEESIALTPYSALASGRLSRLPGETSRRLEEDPYAKFKYDATAEADAGKEHVWLANAKYLEGRGEEDPRAAGEPQRGRLDGASGPRVRPLGLPTSCTQARGLVADARRSIAPAGVRR